LLAFFSLANLGAWSDKPDVADKQNAREYAGRADVATRARTPLNNQALKIQIFFNFIRFSFKQFYRDTYIKTKFQQGFKRNIRSQFCPTTKKSRGK